MIVAAAGALVCLAVATLPDERPVALLTLHDTPPTFAITYLHSVTRTPVEERYQVEGAGLVQTEMRFEQHGPGLPTEADAGGTFTTEDGRFVSRMSRRFDGIRMRVHRDQRPTLSSGGGQVDLSRWCDRGLMVVPVDCPDGAAAPAAVPPQPAAGIPAPSAPARPAR